MKSILRFALVSAVVMIAGFSRAQIPDLTGVSILTYPVSGNVYMLEATGDVAGNIAVSIGEDGILIVDDQFEDLGDQILDAISDLHTGPLQFILNTHHHEDHSDGNAVLSAATGATVVAHERARARLLNKAAAHWPVVTYAEGLTIYFNGEPVQVLGITGGHTDNDSIVIFEESKVVHMGDLFNSGRTSFPLAHIAAGGNAIRILENIDKILPLVPTDAKVIAGHGPLSDRDGLVDLREMLAFTIDFVHTRKVQGQSLSAIQAEGFPDEYDEWNGYITATEWMEMIYQSL